MPASGPLRVKVRDATTGSVRTVVLGLEDFRASLLMPPEAWPAFVLSLYHRHYDDRARDVLQERQGTDSPVRLIAPLIDSSLGVSAEREHLLRNDSGADDVGLTDFDALIASASAWPTPDVGDALRLPAPSPIPVLFFHGDWDTSTPIDNTLGMLPYFPNGRALLVHRGVHHTRAPVFDQHPEVLAQVIAFLKTGDTRGFPVGGRGSLRPSSRPGLRAARADRGWSPRAGRAFHAAPALRMFPLGRAARGT